eukprot:2092704-Rhodomonas_salina.4
MPISAVGPAFCVIIIRVTTAPTVSAASIIATRRLSRALDPNPRLGAVAGAGIAPYPAMNPALE